jgi:hypothetical protein
VWRRAAEDLSSGAGEQDLGGHGRTRRLRGLTAGGSAVSAGKPTASAATAGVGRAINGHVLLDLRALLDGCRFLGDRNYGLKEAQKAPPQSPADRRLNCRDVRLQGDLVIHNYCVFAPNGWRLSGADGVRCSRGLGHE